MNEIPRVVKTPRDSRPCFMVKQQLRQNMLRLMEGRGWVKTTGGF